MATQAQTATQVQTMPTPRWANQKASPGGIFNQVAMLFTHPKAFFQRMPRTRHWLLVAALILVIAGFTASTQTNQAQSSTATSSTRAAGLNTSGLQTASSSATTQAAGNTSSQATSATTTTATTASAAQQSTSPDANSTLMSGLLAASGVLAMWVGQAILLCLVSMLRSYAPDFGRSLQIAVWASLPLALMLVLRQINFAMGGTGGALGLSLVLTQWDGYARLSEPARRLLAVFMSNISLFSLWSLVLLYLGARYALSGNRLSVMLVTLMWVASAAIVPVLVGNTVTSTAPRTTTSITAQQRATTTSTNSSSSSGTIQQQAGAGAFPGGALPPSGAIPPSGSAGSQTNNR